MDLLCFGGNDWWYHNRDHMDVHIMRQFAKYGNALYVNSIVMQKPNVRQVTKFTKKAFRKVKSLLRGLQNTSEGFWVYSPFSLPVHHIAWLKPLNRIILQGQLRSVARKLRIRAPILWVACPAACEIALKLKRRKLIYQRTDRFEAYPNVDVNAIRQYDQKLKANADLVIYVNHKLYEAEKQECKRAIYLDHGVDYEMFATAENNKAKPSDMRDITEPIVGYFGSINPHSVDIAFLEKIVDLLPKMSFVLIGAVSADIAGLKRKENVWFLGQKPYEQIPGYGKCFDVAMLPLPRNRWTEASNPIKLKNYLALGKPVVSVPIPELKKYLDVVYEAGTPEKFAECIEKALAEDSPERIAGRRKEIQAFTWERKAQLVRETLFGRDCAFGDSSDG